MDLNNIPISVQVAVSEAKIRGLYLSITADMDFLLVMLITECFKLNPSEIKSYYKDKNGKGKDLSELTMYQRIYICKKGLEKYHKKLYDEHKNSFITIEKLRFFRNKLAHEKIDNHISPTDTTKLTFHKLRKNFKIEKYEYVIEDLFKELDEYKKVTQDTLRIFARIMEYPEPLF